MARIKIELTYLDAKGMADELLRDGGCCNNWDVIEIIARRRMDEEITNVDVIRHDRLPDGTCDTVVYAPDELFLAVVEDNSEVRPYNNLGDIS